LTFPQCSGKQVGQTAGKICGGQRRRGAAARLSQLPLEKRALAAAVDAKRRSERIDLAIHAPRLLGEADPERQADIRRRLEFDARMRAIARQRAGHGVEGGGKVTEAGFIFQGVETGIDRDRQSARAVEIVTELYAFGIDRAEIAERCILVDAVHAQTDAAAFAADKPAIRKIVARVGKAAASGVTAVEAGKVAIRVRALAGGRITTEADRPAWEPICHGRGLGMGRSPAQAERRQYQCES